MARLGQHICGERQCVAVACGCGVRQPVESVLAVAAFQQQPDRCPGGVVVSGLGAVLQPADGFLGAACLVEKVGRS